MKKSTIAKKIKSSQKKVTILFTDIEDSTRHWDNLGDIDGRLMVDEHNRLLFPVIKKFNGKIIKTIGDAIMAQFSKPKHALKAGIAMQQALERERNENESFNLRVRIGIHSGDAIVEHNDVFGDVVNVAARVEAKATGSEVLISESAYEKLNEKNFILTKKTKFVPKGKKKSIQVYKCNWMKHEDLIKNIRFTPILPVVKRQKIEIFVYSITCLVGLYFFYMKYIRYFVGDFESAALLILNPSSLIDAYPEVAGGIGIFLIILFLVMVYKIRTIPIFTLRLLKGSFYYCICFLILFTVSKYYKPDFIKNWDSNLHSSDHLFVEVLEFNAPIYEDPSRTAKAIMNVQPGILLLLSDVLEKNDIIWNKILVKKKTFGWIPRVLPPAMGVVEKRVTRAYKYYFKYSDLYILLLSFIGLIWGVLGFSIRPS
ncbi:MAG: adenylate/guanylate cyclase domain-containing protein [Desulfobacterales bacterium]|nr:adenylate/guanylate cyclase domain-containing protein [Desulfobacterales bacterium]MCP4163842.1 adenylate/guanylate cyclase domain-containing protein [Deltaproteobacteria bacterium]